jgi:hypothetical protein
MSGWEIALTETLLRQLNITTLDVGALLAAPRSGGASAAPTIDMFKCRRYKQKCDYE